MHYLFSKWRPAYIDLFKITV